MMDRFVLLHVQVFKTDWIFIRCTSASQSNPKLRLHTILFNFSNIYWRSTITLGICQPYSGEFDCPQASTKYCACRTAFGTSAFQLRDGNGRFPVMRKMLKSFNHCIFSKHPISWIIIKMCTLRILFVPNGFVKNRYFMLLLRGNDCVLTHTSGSFYTPTKYHLFHDSSRIGHESINVFECTISCTTTDLLVPCPEGIWNHNAIMHFAFV